MGMSSAVGPSTVQVFLIIIFVEIFVGILTNVFIVLVNFRDWLRGQKPNSSDQLVVSLACSNTCFSSMNAATILIMSYFTSLVVLEYIFLLIYFAMSYAIFSSSWLSAWLCLFFCVKIINFKGGCLGWVKTKITFLVPWLIFVSQMLALASCLPLIWSIDKVYAPNSTLSDTGTNKTSKVVGYKIGAFYNLFSLLFNCCVPFLIVMATTGRIIASLCLHTRHMKQTMEDARGPSLKAHQAAARTMSSLLLLYLLFYVVELAIGLFSQSSPLYWVSFMLILSFPTLQSIILINGNTKLRQLCSRMMTCKQKQ